MSKKVAVLSRFKENNHKWFNLLKNKYDKVIVYNKFEGDNLIPNVGRESHTYLYYIIENYNSLPDEILFSQYKPDDHFSKTNIYKHYNTDHINDFLNAGILDFVCIRPTDYDLFVRGRTIQWKNFFKLLYKDNIDLNHVVTTGACLNGIFRVTKEAILKHDINFYRRALEMLSADKHPDEGYFFERAWKYIFTNYGNCPDKFNYIKNSIWLFGNDISDGVSKQRRDEAYGHIKFYDDGLIGGRGYSLYQHVNEYYWTINNSKLYILAVDSAISSCYELTESINNIKEIRGDYYTRKNSITNNFFFLRKPLWQYYTK